MELRKLINPANPLSQFINRGEKSFDGSWILVVGGLIGLASLPRIIAAVKHNNNLNQRWQRTKAVLQANEEKFGIGPGMAQHLSRDNLSYYEPLVQQAIKQDKQN